MSAERAGETVRVLAREPRPAGGAAETRARRYCAERLEAAGFRVAEEAFEYSSFVGRWGTPIGGLTAIATVLAASVLGRTGRGGTALLLLALGAGALGVVASAMARSGVLTFPAERRRGVNLVATRGVDAPAIWLMAHLDSKSQPVPILVRAAGVTVLAAAWIAALALAALQVATAEAASSWSAPWMVVAAVACLGALPVIATTVGARSPGALDNASGVATVLAAAEASGVAGRPLGICLTSAEELGLAGARAWVRAPGRPPGVAINCDGVDDRGATTCMYSGRRPDRLVEGVLDAARRTGTSVRAHRLLPGVLTDGVALADAGWSVVTLSKGTVQTLATIHTARDRADALAGTGIDEVARVMVALIDHMEPWKS